MSEPKPPDLNDQLLAGTLPADPFVGVVMSEDVPRIWSVRDLLAESMRFCLEQTRRSYCTLGHHAIDRATGGALAGEATFLGADSSWGKSSYAVMVADDNSRRGKRVLVVSAEDSKLTFANRLMRRRARVPAKPMRDKHLSSDELARVIDAHAKSELAPVFIDARGKPVEWLAPRIKTAINEHGIELLVCDYVGAFNKSKHLNDQGQRGTTQYIARTLVDIVKTCSPTGIAALILSQLTLDEKSPVPGKYSLRDSKDLVHMAENVLIGFIAPDNLTQEAGNRAVASKGDRCIRIVKAKEGEISKLPLVLPWNDTVACFETDLDPEQLRLDSLGAERYP